MRRSRTWMVTTILAATLTTIRAASAAETAQPDAGKAMGTNAAAVIVSAAFIEVPTETATSAYAALAGPGEQPERPHGAMLPMTGLDWDKTLRVLTTNRSADVLSCPKVVTLDGTQAQVKITREVPIPVPATPKRGNSPTGEVSEATMEDVGVIFTVTPVVAKDGQSICLTLNASVNELVEDVTPPVIAAQTVNTTILVKDGEAILLGGLEKESTIVVRDRVPVLGRLPLLGALFTRTRHETVSRSMYILVQAQRIKSNHD